MVKLFLPIRRKLFFGHFLAVLLVCGTVGSYIYLSAVDNLKGSLQSRLRNSAALLSEILDAARLDEIQGEAAPTLPVYQQDLALLRAFRRSNPDIAYLYVMRRVADRVYFVLDSDETDRQALPGREYTESVPALLEGFSQPSVDDEIVTDEWGATLSGYAPVKNGAGRYLIGIDMDATQVWSKFQKLHISAIIALFLGFFLAVLLSRFLASQFTSRIALLISRCRAIAEGGRDEPVVFRRGDEMDALIEAFNGMSRRLAESQERRRQAEEALTLANEGLEAGIRERTLDLQELNGRLQQEIERRNETLGALRASEERYRDLADLLPQPVFEADPAGRLSFLNRAAFDTLGYLQEDLDKGLKLQTIYTVSTMDQIALAPRPGANGDRIEFAELTARRKDGSSIPTLLYASAIENGGQRVGLRGIIVDMTEHKLLEEELFRTQNLESIGILAGGIAHDFNNLLTAILGNVSLAGNLIGTEPQVSKLLSDAEKASLQARNLTRQLISLAQGSAPAKTIFALGGTISDATQLALSGSNAGCRLHLADDLWPIHGDPGQIHQLVTNVVMNARDFMPEGGIVEVNAENVALTGGEVASLAAGRYVKLSIKDHGQGIAEKDLPKVFDPYFSTKARGCQKGMGLGLTIAYAIARRHGGQITIQSTPGKGTVVQAYLPASAETPRAASPDSRRRPPSCQRRLLYMDDDDMVRELAEEMLHYLGYEVQVARDGLEAVQLYREAMARELPFDLVVLDLTVRAGMGGKEALRVLQELDPSVRAVVASGYADDPVMAAFAEHGFMGAISKPYQMEKLSEVVQSAIGSAGC